MRLRRRCRVGAGVPIGGDLSMSAWGAACNGRASIIHFHEWSPIRQTSGLDGRYPDEQGAWRDLRDHGIRSDHYPAPLPGRDGPTRPTGGSLRFTTGYHPSPLPGRKSDCHRSLRRGVPEERILNEIDLEPPLFEGLPLPRDEVRRSRSGPLPCDGRRYGAGTTGCPATPE